MCKIGQRVEWFGAYWEAPAPPAPIQYYYIRAQHLANRRRPGPDSGKAFSGVYALDLCRRRPPDGSSICPCAGVDCQC